MCDDLPFEPPDITDEDIRWTSRLLGLPEDAFYGQNGDDPRHDVLKCMEQIDVAACPGSGKTTLLVAKLAILAKVWEHRTRGICVLSHTNAARREIESKLGNTTVGRDLLSYPHFVGTIHGFVNAFLAIPWLRSLGYPIKMIDTDVCVTKRWALLPHNTRYGLEKNHHSPSLLCISAPDFSFGQVRWGKGRLGSSSETYTSMQSVCRTSIEEGYHCYEEMFVWAAEVLDKVPSIRDVIRSRFPLVFIDESQDNSEAQSKLLHRIFMEGIGQVLRQRFGDLNQAIYNFLGDKGATTDGFPGAAYTRELPNSHRFGPKVAMLAEPLGLVPYKDGLRGQGPKKIWRESIAPEGPHTIFLFDKSSEGNVLDAYAELLIGTFSEEELKHGTFTAVGQVHRAPEKEEDRKFPHHVGHYWADYDPELSKADPKPRTFVQYILAGMQRAEMIKEAFPAVEMTAKGVLRLAGMAEDGVQFRRSTHCHRYVLQLLEQNPEVRDRYGDVVARFTVTREAPTKEMWNDQQRGIVRKIAEAVAGSALSSAEAEAFLTWEDAHDSSSSRVAGKGRRDNSYRYPVVKPKVHINVGSVHSVKGQTHTATLVLETFWQDKRGRHNLEMILPWLDGSKPAGGPGQAHQDYRLKLHYVAMTRPTHLLCLAMKRSTFENGKGGLDTASVLKLEARGWDIKVL